MSGSIACLIALRAFVWPDLSHWPGLPACNLAEVRQVFATPGDSSRGSGYVGEDHRALSWMSISGGGFPDSIRAWFDGDQLVMMDSTVRSDAPTLKALVAKLGQPAARLDWYFSNALLEHGEWVYPDRGLTLFIEPETHALLRVEVFPRTTLADYRKRFRFVGGRTVREAGSKG